MRHILIILILLLSSISWADSTVFNNDSYIFDSFIKSDNANTNYGTAVSGFTYDGIVVYYYMLIVTDFVNSIGAGQIIDSAKFHWCHNNTTGPNNYLYYWLCWKPYWIELEITYNEWYASTDSAWTDPGALCANDAGAFNASVDDATCIADSADRTATAFDSVLVPTGAAVGDTFTVYVTDGVDTSFTHNENLSLIFGSGADYSVYINTRESATAAFRPWLVVYHHAEAAVPKTWGILK